MIGDNHGQISLEYLLIFTVSLIILLIFTLSLAENSIKDTLDVSDKLSVKQIVDIEKTDLASGSVQFKPDITVRTIL